MGAPGKAELAGGDSVTSISPLGSFAILARLRAGARHEDLRGPGRRVGARDDLPSVIAVSQVDGGGLHQVTGATTGNTVVYAIGNGFCAMGRNYGSGVTFFGILGVAGLRLARRRKKNAR